MDEPKSSVSAIESLLRQGKVFAAYNAALAASRAEYDNIRIAQLMGLSLARLGATRQAQEGLEHLCAAGHTDPETCGILGRVYKDIWSKTGDDEYARRSRDIYLRSFRESGNYYTGINAATMSLVIGERDIARALASDVVKVIGVSTDDYWGLATLGEAELLLGDRDASLQYYRSARTAGGNNFGDVNSTYRQLMMLSRFIPMPGAILDSFRPPAIIAFAGHMIDRPERAAPRFPENRADAVKAEIVHALERMDAGIGYSSAACGADILFVEAMLERHAEINVYLPFRLADFVHTSVTFAGDQWVSRFNRIIESAGVKYITEESFLGNDDLFLFTNKVVVGMSILRGEQFMTTPSLLAVSDSMAKGSKIGGTAETIALWPFKDRLAIINPLGQGRSPEGTAAAPIITTGDPAMPAATIHIKRSLRNILFADIVGFSKLQEEQTPFFMYELLRAISDELAALHIVPDVLNTWGDAIFATYESAAQLMKCALTLRRIVRDPNWTAKNLPPDMNIRIALHAGPVFIGEDPLTMKRNAYGAHINRTARMEPVTFPGCIYASEQFAAILKLETGDAYRYEYVGVLELPKNFGRQEMYHLSDRNEAL